MYAVVTTIPQRQIWWLSTKRLTVEVMCTFCIQNRGAVKLVLRGHLWDKGKMWPYKTGDLLRGSINIKKIMTGQEKGGILIKVTA